MQKTSKVYSLTLINCHISEDLVAYFLAIKTTSKVLVKIKKISQQLIKLPGPRHSLNETITICFWVSAKSNSDPQTCERVLYIE